MHERVCIKKMVSNKVGLVASRKEQILSRRIDEEIFAELGVETLWSAVCMHIWKLKFDCNFRNLI